MYYIFKKSKITKRGFTLIELLVVIAIIGILVSVVLASLNTARDKGTNAAIKSNLNNSRAQSAIYFDSAGSVYEVVDGSDSVCVNGSGASIKGIKEILDSAQFANGAGGDVICNDTPSQMAIAAQLVGVDSGDYYCTDSTGVAGVITGAVGGVGVTDFQAGDLTCN